MSLQSQLFGGDPKLEAAAVSDPAHITPGATGQHVGKIQRALLQIDGAAIAPGELQGMSYGATTAAAVLAFKQKRGIVNRSYQTTADNIVGKMTMAALDAEMVRKEAAPVVPARIVPLHPVARLASHPAALAPRRRGAALAFKIGAEADPRPTPHIIPNGPTLAIELREHQIGTFQVIFGVGGTVRCADPTVGLVTDPASPQVHSGTLRVTREAHLFRVRGVGVGSTVIEFRDGSSPSFPLSGELLALTVRSSGGPFVSPEGTPLKPKGTRRKINLYGEGETPGFEDYASDAKYQAYQRAGRLIVRPRTDDPARPPGIANEEASDICIRSTPVSRAKDEKGENYIIREIRRIAMHGCRVTYAGPGAKFGSASLAETNGNIALLLDSFPNADVLEESTPGDFKAIVFEIP